MNKYTRSAIAGLTVLLTASISFSQTYQTYKGQVMERTTKTFQEMDEFDKLYPELKTKGRQIKNEIDKYPDLPLDKNNIIYMAPKGFYNNSFTPKDPSPAPDADFLGLDDSGGSIPPDVNGAPGPEHLMVTLNTDIRIQDRQGTNLYTIGTGSFWHPLATGGVFDPKISYDPYENRWILIMPGSSNPASSRLMVGVSENSDPTGTWYLYSFDTDPTDTHWFDYPNYGFSKDKIVVTGNMFGGGGVYVALFVFDKMQLYNNAFEITYTRLTTWDGFTIVPAVTYDPDVEDIYMVHNISGNMGGYGYINLWSITGSADDPTMTSIGSIGVPQPWSNGSYANGGNFAPQLGSDEKINTVDARMENLVYRNDKLWTAHHVYLPQGNPNRCAIQWWELALDGELLQWGRVDDPSGEMNFAFAGIAVNAKEDVMIGFGSFSENQYASSSYAFRYAGDPPNTMRDFYQYKDGKAPYFKTFGGDRNRWGDYTSTWVDPVDDLDFWTLQEYAELPASQDEWGTWWAYVNIDAAPEADFAANITSVPVGSGASFTDRSKFDPVSWNWTFEGGVPGTSTDQNPQNIMYENEGLYDVTLTVTNYLGSNTLVMENYINANTTILPEVDFVVNDTIPCLGDTIFLEDLSIYNANQWQWEVSPPYAEFVNGTNANSQHPQIRIDLPYTYEISLTATNNNGSSTLVKSNYIKAGGKPLPFTENFETRNFSSQGWTVDNPDGNKTWDFITVGGTAPGNIASYVNIKNYIGLHARDRLITPRLNFYSYKDISLTFDFAYAQRFAVITDSLIVSISDDCGNSWTRLLALGEDSSSVRTFSTTDPYTNEFIPSTESEWCGEGLNPACINIDLSQWKGMSNIQIMFESYNGYGNNLFIDNVSISGQLSGMDDISPISDGIRVYPNPSNGKFTVGLPEGSKANIRVFTISGINVFQHNYSSDNGSLISVNLKDIPKGIYILEVSNEKGSYTEKLMIR
ncbi:MAG: T9SS type A sorting domain-containing protein [Bacteroidales bacterium]